MEPEALAWISTGYTGSLLRCQPSQLSKLTDGFFDRTLLFPSQFECDKSFQLVNFKFFGTCGCLLKCE